MVFCDGFLCLHGTTGINAGGLAVQVGGKRFWLVPPACGVFGTFGRFFRRQIRKSLCYHPGSLVRDLISALEFPGRWSVPHVEHPL